MHTGACLWVTKTNVGDHKLCVSTAAELLKAGEQEEKKELCALLFLISGESLKITIQITISAWWILQNKEKENMRLYVP